jgi:hypothetical protein
VRGALHPHEPRGEHARTWRRWLSEAQMLLHEHPVNVAREARGQPPVTALWISEGGVQATPASTSAVRFFAPDGRVGDVARGLARYAGAHAEPPPEGFAALPAGDSLVVLPPASTDTVDMLERHWLAPAVDALERGRLAQCTMVADGPDGAWTWHAHVPALVARMRARWAAAPFARPRA